ncbi:ATP-binding protein [Bacteroides gallinaceum]|uniref:ATP-binding protein n=1 Tax=Bacteroides gallinaceum TaxID=1462571 RepID=UPI00195CFE71|nr:ATP-binding protein [Bacteroides gallinaceum]MBM6720993.1 ATP-binding protein [Bacteroides gallinaceum]
MKYPIGIQNFEKLRQDGYLYIDKTGLVYSLVQTSNCYFLSRPRRFGKSLLLSILEAYFLGKKELFKGLAIEKLEQEWTVYPVLHLDLNIEKYDSIDNLTDILNVNLKLWEQTYGSDDAETSVSLRFAGIIRRAYKQTGRRVVVLVDEYDKPLLQSIGNKALQEEFRNTLKPFYGVLKSLDGCIRFALLTGVTKFGKVSVFSDLNNLDDISMNNQYATLCGITEKEIHTNIEEGIRSLASAQNLSYEETCVKLKEMYDGYHFTSDSEGIYNPFSLFNALKNKTFGNYWFETGTPTYLVELLKRNRYNLKDMTETVSSADVLNSIYGDDEPIPVIYQSGYLTIKGYNPRFKTYRLGFPNKEVEEGFMNFLIPYYTPIKKEKTAFSIENFVEEIERGDINSFFRRLQSFFADTPYELVRDRELHYQNVLFIVFKLIGLYVKAEYHTSQGRIDLALQTDKYIYVMEFKLEGSAEEALRQIEEKQYALPFVTDKRQVFQIGINFSSQTRNIEKWLVK